MASGALPRDLEEVERGQVRLEDPAAPAGSAAAGRNWLLCVAAGVSPVSGMHRSMFIWLVSGPAHRARVER